MSAIAPTAPLTNIDQTAWPCQSGCSARSHLTEKYQKTGNATAMAIWMVEQFGLAMMFLRLFFAM